MGELFKVSLVQTDIRWKEPQQNLSYFRELIANLHELPDLIVFPEMFTTGFLNDPSCCGEHMDGISVEWMKNIAKEYNTYVAGSLVITENGRYFNRFVLAGHDGSLQFYDKRHLFKMDNEESLYQPGNQRKIFKIGNWRICPQVCYDLRFPVWSRNLNDYDLIIYVANWPEVRKDVWKTLLQARAIENISYCIGVNRTGIDGNGINYPGESRVVDFKGLVLADMKQDFNGIRTVELSKLELEKFKNSFPAHQDADNFQIRK